MQRTHPRMYRKPCAWVAAMSALKIVRLLRMVDLLMNETSGKLPPSQNAAE